MASGQAVAGLPQTEGKLGTPEGQLQAKEGPCPPLLPARCPLLKPAAAEVKGTVANRCPRQGRYHHVTCRSRQRAVAQTLEEGHSWASATGPQASPVPASKPGLLTRSHRVTEC